MKLEKIAFRFLIISILLTIISGKVALPLALKYLNIFLLICIIIYYFINLVIRSIHSNLKGKITEFISGVLFVFTGVFLILIQTVHSAEILTTIKIMVLANAIYSIFLRVRFENRNLSTKHYLICFLLIGVSVFIPVS